VCVCVCVHTRTGFSQKIANFTECHESWIRLVPRHAVFCVVTELVLCEAIFIVFSVLTFVDLCHLRWQRGLVIVHWKLLEVLFTLLSPVVDVRSVQLQNCCCCCYYGSRLVTVTRFFQNDHLSIKTGNFKKGNFKFQQQSLNCPKITEVSGKTVYS